MNGRPGSGRASHGHDENPETVVRLVTRRGGRALRAFPEQSPAGEASDGPGMTAHTIDLSSCNHVWSVATACSNHPGQSRSAVGQRTNKSRVTHYPGRIGLPGIVAPEIEAAARAALTLAEVMPAKGLEYYDVSALAIVLDVADNWPRY